MGDIYGRMIVEVRESNDTQTRAFKMAEYAIPTDVETIVQTNEILVQRAIMLNSDDAIVYARQCREFGAGYWIAKNGLEVVVVYSLDSDGKIS